MRTYNRDLKRARRWLASGRSTKVIRYLEPKVPLFLEDPDYYAILGRSCLEAGLLKDADTYLNRGLQADPVNVEIRLTLAVNHLKRKDPAAAVRTWLEVLEDHRDDKYANRGLKTMKSITSQEAQDKFIASFSPRRFLPDIRSRWPAGILTVLIILLLFLMGLYFLEEIGSVVSSLSDRTHRLGSERFIVDQKGPLTTDSANIPYPMSDGEVTQTMKKAMKHFQAYEDNQARFELNKIMNSNASAEIRDQAEGLIESLREPEIEGFENSFDYADVESLPALYEGCWVLWRGMTANVLYDNDAIRFDFLVGFDEGRILEGRVPVEIPFLTVMEPLPLELLARVENREDGFHLIAKTLHFLR